MRGNPPVSFGKGATEKGRVIGTSLVPYFILRGWGAGNSILLPDTVMNDAEWIADLLRHGLLRPSFVPSVQERELRELTRHQTRLIEERSRVINRLQKVLEDANIKLAVVASDLMGKSARAMLSALLQDEVDPAVLSELALGNVNVKRIVAHAHCVWCLKALHMVK